MKSYDLDKFKGVTVAINSCYDNNGNIYQEAVKRLIRFLINKGVSGVYVCGSTGEGLLQSIEERKQVLEAVIAESQGEIAVIAHIGAMTTRDSIELAAHAERAGADAISAVPPFYYRHSEEAVQKHWAAIMDSTELPFIIYHIPATTGFILTTGLLRRMIENPKVIGVKVSVASTFELERFKSICGKDFLIFNGPDEQYLAGRVMGADGGIGGTYGCMPELFVRLEQYYANGMMKEAQRLQTLINDIITDLLSLPTHSALKEIIRLRGIDCGTVRAPMEEVQQSQIPLVMKIHEKIMQTIGELAPVGE
ncbi:dihydrodipicolinate synthase family protein [Paenibacillus nasutitermitis]|uniref:N-acetylneuraminate lyase n=1 Tax=Paenibacillus nasutitermitis TaxID=1652958 RepID=A0A917DLW2_9BACL|nr:dihydrodipicolinate synthase family protein [Paenibacillus nasutitermitis]GGD50937.1 N-acetylneuraminate lyase [Paenibacillus nasutitermitis]